MTRATAYKILTKYITNPILLTHSLAAEATMRALAVKLGGNIEEWGITGLLHDADYEKAKGNPQEHGAMLFKLEPNSIPSTIEHAIKSHNFTFTKVMPTTKMDWAITCCDELTGVILQAALKNKEKKLENVTSESIQNKLQQNHFPKEVKGHILLCEEKLDILLDEFIDTTLTAMQGIHEELDL